MALKIALLFLVISAIVILILFKLTNTSPFSALGFQTKNICSQRLSFCTDVPTSWQIEDTDPKADLKVSASSFRCPNNSETNNDPTNANEYSSGDQTFTVLKLSTPKDIARDDTLSCIQNNCPDLSNLSITQRQISGKNFSFVQQKNQNSPVTKVYYKATDGYYAFYFDSSSFPNCGVKTDPKQVLEKFLKDFSTK